jgi:hypothetical protein
MAGSTPIYGFPYPQPSDLVANYPALGQDLAEDVETVIAGLGAGLTHINTTTFSAVSSVSIDSVFSATYDNYLIQFNEVVCTVDSQAVNFRLRVAGVDASGANYDHQVLVADSTAVNASRLTGQTSARIATSRTLAEGLDLAIDLWRPALAKQTNYSTQIGFDPVSGAAIRAYVGNHSVTTAYDGITFLVASGNMTGIVRIYGYKNS